MSEFFHVTNLILLVIIIILIQSHLRRWLKRLRKGWKTFKQRQWKPTSPHDCHLCCNQADLQVIKQRDVVPYHQTKSPRGRKKSVKTHGFACPNPNCDYCGIVDASVHALVGYGHHNRIPRFKCQACGKVFTSRIGTPLYYLKTSPKHVEMVLWFLAEGVDMSVMIRFTGHADTTIARWLNHMGGHAQRWHNRLFRNLVFVVLQLSVFFTPLSAFLPKLAAFRSAADAKARMELSKVYVCCTRSLANVPRPYRLLARQRGGSSVHILFSPAF